MAVPLEAFLADAYLAGSFEGTPAELRSLLDAGSVVELGDVTLVALANLTADAAERSSTDPVDAGEILFAAPPPDPDAPAVHQVYIPVMVTLGPYVAEGHIPTFPGFDPSRALTRPASEFVELRDAELRIATGDVSIEQPYETLIVNRFAVERVTAEVDVSFWFPGAEQELLTEE